MFTNIPIKILYTMQFQRLKLWIYITYLALKSKMCSELNSLVILFNLNRQYIIRMILLLYIYNFFGN